MPAAIRTPQQIIDALAERRGFVTPVPPYFPLGPAFTRECVAEAYRDVVIRVAEAMVTHQGHPEVVTPLKALLDQLGDRLKDE